MSVMRGVAPFKELWRHRTTIAEEDGESYDLLSLPELVQAKKTQCDKDWPMLRRLVDVDYLRYRAEATPARVVFWLRELRTPELLTEAVRVHSNEAAALVMSRPLIAAAQAGDLGALADGLHAEEMRERLADATYWAPLRAELEQLRRRAST